MIETFQKYSGSGLILGWFLVSWCYLLLKEEKKQNRVMLVYMPAGILLIFYNPFFYRLFGNMTEEAIYFRFLWLLPVTIVIGYSVIHIMSGLSQRRKPVFGFIVVLLILISGKWVYSNPLFQKAENPYHMPKDVVEICDAIRVEGREVMAAFPREFLLYVRQYSPYVCMPYGREVFDEYDEFFAVMEQEEIDMSQLAQLAKQHGCHFLILSKEKILKGEPEDFSYEVFKEMEEYLIYRDTSIYMGL